MMIQSHGAEQGQSPVTPPRSVVQAVSRGIEHRGLREGQAEGVRLLLPNRMRLAVRVIRIPCILVQRVFVVADRKPRRPRAIRPHFSLSASRWAKTVSNWSLKLAARSMAAWNCWRV